MRPSCSRVAWPRFTTPMIRPSYITAIRSERAQISSRSSEIRRIPVPCFALLEEPLVDVLGGADVHTAGGLGGDEDFRVPRELARHDELLDVAARKVLQRRVQARESSRRTPRRAGPRALPCVESSGRCRAECRGRSDRGGRCSPGRRTRGWRRPASAPRGCRPCPASTRWLREAEVMSRAPSRTVPAVAARMPGKALGQLALPVAGDPRQADDLSRVDLQVHAAQRLGAAVPHGAKPLHAETHRAGLAPAAAPAHRSPGRPSSARARPG